MLAPLWLTAISGVNVSCHRALSYKSRTGLRMHTFALLHTILFHGHGHASACSVMLRQQSL